jgi:hypothetical protein
VDSKTTDKENYYNVKQSVLALTDMHALKSLGSGQREMSKA